MTKTSVPLTANETNNSYSYSPHEALVQQLDLMLRARYPLLYVVAVEEEPVEDVLLEVAILSQPERKLLLWDIVRGWDDNGADKGSAMAALSRIARAAETDNTIFVLRDLHYILQNPCSDRNAPVIREIKNLTRELKRSRKTLVLTSHTLVVPAELSEEVTVIDFPLPNVPEIDHLIGQVAKSELKLTGLAKEQLVKACQGLSRARIGRVLAKALAAKQRVDETDIDGVLEEKKQTIRQTGILEFFTTRESLKNVGGLENLKQWVRMRQ